MKILRCGIKFFSLKISSFGLRDLWKGLFVARGWGGWGHECQLLGVGSRVPTFCITRVNFLHHSSQLFASLESTFCITRGHFLHHSWLFELTRRHSWCKKWALVTPHPKVGTRDPTTSPLVQQKGLFHGLEAKKKLLFGGKKRSPGVVQKFCTSDPTPKVCTCDPTPSPLVHKKASSKVDKANKNWFSGEKQFSHTSKFSPGRNQWDKILFSIWSTLNLKKINQKLEKMAFYVVIWPFPSSQWWIP